MDFLQALGLCDHRLLQCPYRNIESGSCLDNPEASSCGDLIISAAPGVKLRCNVTDLFMQQTIDHRMNVFVSRIRLFAARKPLAYQRKPTLYLIALIE